MMSLFGIDFSKLVVCCSFHGKKWADESLWTRPEGMSDCLGCTSCIESFLCMCVIEFVYVVVASNI